jgi:hypothetical protein
MGGSQSNNNALNCGANGDDIRVLFLGCYFNGYEASCISAVVGSMSRSSMVLIGNYAEGFGGTLGHFLESNRMFICAIRNIVKGATHTTKAAIHLYSDSSFGSGHVLFGNTVYDGDYDGIDTITAWGQRGSVLINNVSVNSSGGYGIRGPGLNTDFGFIDFNNLDSNTSGPSTGYIAGANEIAVDPEFINPSGDNFGVGASMKGTGYPGSVTIADGKSATENYEEVGASQREETSGGGVTVINKRKLVR